MAYTWQTAICYYQIVHHKFYQIVDIGIYETMEKHPSSVHSEYKDPKQEQAKPKCRKESGEENH